MEDWLFAFAVSLSFLVLLFELYIVRKTNFTCWLAFLLGSCYRIEDTLDTRCAVLLAFIVLVNMLDPYFIVPQRKPRLTIDLEAKRRFDEWQEKREKKKANAEVI